jgi:hypothetical protein
VKRLWEDDELAVEWTLEPSDQTLLANKAGPTRLGFAALRTFFRHEGRFPTSKHEVPPAVVKHLASQVGVPADAYLAYDWQGRAIKYHRAQIRAARLAPAQAAVVTAVASLVRKAAPAAKESIKWAQPV